jgi:hypothetical protein
MAKEEWRDLTYDKVDWSAFETAQTTIKEQTNSGEQNLSQFVSHGEKKLVNISRKENMLFLRHGERRLEPRPNVLIVTCNNGTGGFMGKSQEGHGTV